ncbi:DUF433 domain-containing protein [Candidatus Berkelbacteria bacterium]|nr:DUF433 domain-containing protein [Candidatus Berkelbacteria bacterium]
MKEIAPRIVVDPKIRFGQPIIKGTRITADEVLGFVAAGMANDAITKEYGLTQEDILAAIKYRHKPLQERLAGDARGLIRKWSTPAPAASEFRPAGGFSAFKLHEIGD